MDPDLDMEAPATQPRWEGFFFGEIRIRIWIRRLRLHDHPGRTVGVGLDISEIPTPLMLHCSLQATIEAHMPAPGPNTLMLRCGPTPVR